MAMIPLPVRLNLEVDGQNQFRATIINQSGLAFNLILPQDGSLMAWRPPYLTYAVGPDDRSPLPKPERPQFARCGNVNAIETNAFFRLEPGASKTFLVPRPPALKPGIQRVYLDYEIDPARELKGVSPPLSAEVKQKLKNLSPIKLRSNLIRVKVSNDRKLTEIALPSQ